MVYPSLSPNSADCRLYAYTVSNLLLLLLLLLEYS